jgi:hypothetical protein
MLAALAVAAFLTAPARAAEAPLLVVVAERTIPPSAYVPAPAPGQIAVPLALVVEDGSGWDAPGLLEKDLGKASSVFAQCGVALGEAQVVTVRWSAEALRRLNDDDPYAGPSKMTVMAEPLIPKRRPVGFLFGKSIPSMAEAYNKSTVDTFKGAHPDAALLLDTFWMTVDMQTRKLPSETPTYSLMAHELTHILGNLAHTTARPNLMNVDSTPGSSSGDLTPEQCAAIRTLELN